MKKFLIITAVGMLLTAPTAFGQKKKSVAKKVENAAKDAGKGVGTAAKDVGKGVGTAAKDVGNKTAEVASKGASKVTDQVYKGKQGPDGQTIYIDNKSKYYWVDDKGHHQYITATQMKDKP